MKCVHLFLVADLPPPYHSVSPHYPPSSPQSHPHSLRQNDRKLSAPVLGTPEMAALEFRNELLRSDEVENIPENVDEEPTTEELPPPPPTHFSRYFLQNL